MASTKREIKTTLSLDGEKQFKDAISDSKSELKVLGSELKELTSAYKLNGDQVGYLKSKHEVLKKELKQQEEIVKLTAEMYQKAADGGEEFVGKAQRLNVQLNNSKSALNRLKAEIQATDREMEELGRDSIAAGRDIERGLTDAAQDASREIKDMVTETEGSLGKMKSLFSGGVGITATIGAVVGVGVGAFNTLSGLAEEGAEYTLTVGKLRANAEIQGADWDFIQGEMLRVTAITGDANVAVQGISSILNTGVQDAETLTTLVDMLMGATIKYTDLDFGGVANDLQKTVGQRELVGSVADIVRDMGYDVEEVNKELQNAETDAAALNIVMSKFAEGGLKDVYDKYYDIHEEVIDSRIAQGKLNDEWQELGTNISIWMTPFTDSMATIIGYINDAITGTRTWSEAWSLAMMEMRGQELAVAEPLVIDAGYDRAYDSDFVEFKAGPLDDSGYGDMMMHQWFEKYKMESLPEATKKTIDETLAVIGEFEKDASEAGTNVGKSYMDAFIAVFDSQMDEIYERVNRIDQLLQKPLRNVPYYGSFGGAHMPEETNVVINMELDGHRMGAALVPYIDSAMGKQQARTNFG